MTLLENSDTSIWQVKENIQVLIPNFVASSIGQLAVDMVNHSTHAFILHKSAFPHMHSVYEKDYIIWLLTIAMAAFYDPFTPTGSCAFRYII